MILFFKDIFEGDIARTAVVDPVKNKHLIQLKLSRPFLARVRSAGLIKRNLLTLAKFKSLKARARADTSPGPRLLLVLLEAILQLAIIWSLSQYYPIGIFLSPANAGMKKRGLLLLAFFLFPSPPPPFPPFNVKDLLPKEPND